MNKSKRYIRAGVVFAFLICLCFSCYISNLSIENNYHNDDSETYHDDEYIKSDIEIPENFGNVLISAVNTALHTGQSLFDEIIAENTENTDDSKEPTEEDIFTEQSDISPCQGLRYVNAFSLNIRSGPSTDADIIGQLYMNNQVELISKDQTEFYQIKFGDITGYVHQDYLSESKITIKTEIQETTDSITSKYASITNLQERVVAIATENQGTRPCTSGMCAAWVSGVYQAAGLGYPGGNAIDYWTSWKASGTTSMENIPIGAVVVGSGYGTVAGNKYGHVAIYLGNGMVAENVGYHRIISLGEWAAKQVGYCNGYHGYIGWVWPYETSLGNIIY